MLPDQCDAKEKAAPVFFSAALPAANQAGVPIDEYTAKRSGLVERFREWWLPVA